MHSAVFKIAIAVILAAAIFFMIGTAFNRVDDSVNTTVLNMESARNASLAAAAMQVQQ
jgi:hypothetical protein